jgi:hypothetical protein
MLGSLQLNVLNLSKAVRERDARIVALEEENKTMREQLSQMNGKMKEEVVG